MDFLCYLCLVFLMDLLCYLHVCLVFLMLVSVHCCLVVTCWERVDLLALVCGVNCVFFTFPCGILGQVWYLNVSIPDLCPLYYFEGLHFFFNNII